MPKWKLQSLQFRNAMKATSGNVDEYQYGGSSMGGQQRIESYEDNSLKQCPHCTRKFNEDAAARHIPVCAKKAKENAIKSKKPTPVNRASGR